MIAVVTGCCVALGLVSIPTTHRDVDRLPFCPRFLSFSEQQNKHRYARADAVGESSIAPTSVRHQGKRKWHILLRQKLIQASARSLSPCRSTHMVQRVSELHRLGCRRQPCVALQNLDVRRLLLHPPGYFCEVQKFPFNSKSQFLLLQSTYGKFKAHGPKVDHQIILFGPSEIIMCMVVFE